MYLKYHTLTDKGWLHDQYVTKRKSTTKIGQEIGCGPRVISHWLKKHGIKARSTGSTKGHKRNDSAECRDKMSVAKRGMYIGEDNPNWKGGITTRDLDRSRYRAKAWVKAVKDRDGWRCVECGSTEGLHAHHVKSWRYHPDLRYEVSNGKTLCEPCHEAAHGYKFPRRGTPNLHERTAPETG